MPARPTPAGFHTVTPYLLVEDVGSLLDVLVPALGAEVTERMPPDGDTMHAEVQIGDSMVMLGRASGEWSPMPAMLYLYVPDADAAFERAVAAGFTPLQDPRDEFYGDRVAGTRDPQGNLWWLATRHEDLTPDELAARAQAAGKG